MLELAKEHLPRKPPHTYAATLSGIVEIPNLPQLSPGCRRHNRHQHPSEHQDKHIPPSTSGSRRAPSDVRWHPCHDGGSNRVENWHAAHDRKPDARNVSEKNSLPAGWSAGTGRGPHRAGAWCHRPNPYARQRTAHYPPSASPTAATVSKRPRNSIEIGRPAKRYSTRPSASLTRVSSCSQLAKARASAAPRENP